MLDNFLKSAKLEFKYYRYLGDKNARFGSSSTSGD